MRIDLSEEELEALIDHIDDSRHTSDVDERLNSKLMDALAQLRAPPAPLPQEHPNLTEAKLHEKWFWIARDPVPPDTLQEFLQRSLDILHEWYDRWSNLWKKVNPSFFKNPADREQWLHDNSTKSLAVWHAMRELRQYWHSSGVWEGNPYTPEDHGRITLEGLKGPPKKRGKRR